MLASRLRFDVCFRSPAATAYYFHYLFAAPNRTASTNRSVVATCTIVRLRMIDTDGMEAYFLINIPLDKAAAAMNAVCKVSFRMPIRLSP